MTERNPYSLLLFDTFMGEYTDEYGYSDTYTTLDDAQWAALALYEQLHKEERDLGNDDEVLPYKVYLVGPGGSRTYIS